MYKINTSNVNKVKKINVMSIINISLSENKHKNK